MLTREEVVWANRVMLGREPRSEAEIELVLRHLEGGDLRALAEICLDYAVRQHIGPLAEQISANVVQGGPAYTMVPRAKDGQANGPMGKARVPNWLDALSGGLARVYRTPVQGIGRKEVLWGYRLLLGRDPVSEHEIRENVREGSIDALVARLIRSPEFTSNGHLSRLFSIQPTPPAPAHQATAGRHVAAVGNCQIRNIARCLQAATGDLVPTIREVTLAEIGEIAPDHPHWSPLVAENELIFAHEYAATSLAATFPHAREKIVTLPSVYFAAFHPDLVYANSRKSAKMLQSVLGGYNSSLALYGWLRGLSARQTVGLFNGETYERLGFFDYWQNSRAYLLAEGERVGLPLGDALQRWQRRGCFMHSFNHPRLFVAADITRMLLEKLGIATLPVDFESVVPDVFEDGAVWPVYPQIAERLGIDGSDWFRLPKFACPPDRSVLFCDLEQFIEHSFLWFGMHDKEDIVCERLHTEPYRDLEKSSKSSVPVGPTPVNPLRARFPNTARNPYSGLPSYQFWSKGVASVVPDELDPVVVGKFSLAPSEKVATAGSCFAQHIAQRLSWRGFNHYISEEAPGAIDAVEAVRRGYGVFSARYGNLYTARHLSQLMARAYGTFDPVDSAWKRGDGRFADPFRPQIEPDGFLTLAELEASRAVHFAAVRHMFESLDVFVYTLGLTEAWRSKIDGAVFPLAPGVAAGEMDGSRYEFVNFDVDEVIADLDQFFGRLSDINPRGRVILTVSPVPLIASYEDRHVLVSTIYSKSVLRVAAESAGRRYPHCAYFPSYEIITGHYNRGAYFGADLRSVTEAGLDHVMRLFFRHYGATAAQAIDLDRMREAREVSRIVCDEERIVAGRIE